MSKHLKYIIRSKEPISHERLLDLVQYDKNLGVLCYLRQTNGKHIGTPIGTIRHGGYYQVVLDGQFYRRSRLTWFYHYGEWPDGFIDHINGDRTDDSIENLRLASTSENAHNMGKSRRNKTGYKGVCWDKSRNKFLASVRIDSFKNLGRFDTAEEAARAYDRAVIQHWGEFAKTNFPREQYA